MTTAIGRNVKLEIALTFQHGQGVTGITQASPGVATSSAHGLAQWHRRLLDCARRRSAARRHGHARLQIRATNTFELQGLTPPRSRPSPGTPTFTPVKSPGAWCRRPSAGNIGGAGADQLG